MANIEHLLTKNKTHSELLRISGTLGSEHNIPTFVVGGYVRDQLLNRKSSHDIDIMVEGDGIKFAKLLANRLKIKTVVEYKKFGTALIPLTNGHIEVASARTETYESNSRKPKIKFSSIEQDMSRRDFTINAMASCINIEKFGDLYDPFGGIKDLHKGLLITPLDPDETFIDDPLRMLRAARFSAQLNFDVAPNIIDSITRNNERIKIISWERITEEIIKMLSSEKPSIAFYILKETNLLKYIFPELDIMPGVDIINGQGHKDVFIHTLQVVDNAAKLTNKMKIRFAALVHDIAKPQTKRYHKNKGWTFHAHEVIGVYVMNKVAKRMKLSKSLRDYLNQMIKLHLRPIALAKKGVTDSAIRRLMVESRDNEGNEIIDDLMILCRADITTKNPKKVDKYIRNFEKVEQLMKDVKLRDEAKAFRCPIDGHEIMNKFQLTEGRVVGKIKNAIETAILDGIIDNDYDTAYDYMMKIKHKFL